MTNLSKEAENRANPLQVLPTPEVNYLQEIVKRLHGLLGERLSGVYLFGSAGYGAYTAGISDLDVQAVVNAPLEKEECLQIADSLSQQQLPCPATKLEFVCYALPNVSSVGSRPRFELNFNTGQGLENHLTLDPTQEAGHWFILDIALGRELGFALYGLSPAELFGPIPRPIVLRAIEESLSWHAENELVSANSVLNACRCWRYIETGEFGSKLAGAQWASRQPDCPSVVQAAIQARAATNVLQATAVLELYNRVREAIQQALRTA